MFIRDSSTRLETASLVGDAALFSAVLVFAAPATILLGPIAAWLLHRHRLDRNAVVSGLLGLLCALVSCGIMVGFFALFARFSGRFDAFDPTGGIILLVASSAVLLVAAVALDVEAARDLLPGRRVHVWLDIARLSSTMVLILGSVVVTMVQMANPASEIGDAGPFALAFAAVGALTMFFARALQPHVGGGDRRRPTQQRYPADTPPA